EPMMNGIGGDLFVIYWEARRRKLHGLNASGWAPKALTIEHLARKGVLSMPQDGIDSVTVPGVVDGWRQLRGRFGKRSWKELFRPAIYYAERGYPVPEVIHGYWEAAPEALARDKESRRI